MNENHDQRSLLDELDARQNEVLAQLDSLDARVESVLNQWLANREAGGLPPAGWESTPS
jgi:hypothetical protein